TLATKFAYHSAGWLHLSGTERVLYVDAVYGVANVGTFLLRFLFFHYVLFAGSAALAAPGAAEEALASTDPGPEPFARADAPAARRRAGRRGVSRPPLPPDPLTLPPPGAVGHPREAQPVEEVVHARKVQPVERVLALLALTHPPPVD